MDLLICEELLLLGLDDRRGGTGWLEGWAALRSGVLVDAIASRAVDVSDDRLRPGVEPEHPLLRRVRTAVAEERKERTVTDWVTRIGSAVTPLLPAVAAGLVERGILTEERGKVLGLFPTTRYPEADPVPERGLRHRLRRVLVDGEGPTAHDTLLIALLHHDSGGVDRVVGDEERAARRAAKERAADIAEHAADQPGVRGAQDAAVAAAVAATTLMFTTVVITTSGSDGS